MEVLGCKPSKLRLARISLALSDESIHYVIMQNINHHMQHIIYVLTSSMMHFHLPFENALL